MKEFFVNLFEKIWPFLAAVAAFFSYSYYKKTKATNDRVKDHNQDQADIKNDLKENVKELQVAQEKLDVAVAKVEAIKLDEPKPTETMEDSVADFNSKKPKG